MIRYFQEIFTGLWSLFVGMSISFKEFFSPVVTVEYPYQTLTMTPRFRGHIDLVPDENGASKCVICMACERACPSSCITIEGEKKEGEKKKTLTLYKLDFTRCSLCGCCVEACNFGAIDFSKEYNLASTRKEDYYFDLLKRLQEKRQ